MTQGPIANPRVGEREAPERACFSIVGVGASAGGLAATVEFLRRLGAAPNLAVVIVHHLDPTRESGLVEIFSKATPLAVHVAKDDLRVEPNNVYVVPPNADLQLSGGLLKLTPRTRTVGLHLPIDGLFESLALDCTLDAVGVVLTGTGSDGTLGIQAIKAHGGITFAQDRNAEFSSMPDSAIATGCVDFVSSPEGIAEKLIHLDGHLPPLVVAEDDAGDEEDFQRILSMLRAATGVDFANYKRTTVRRRVQRRARMHGLRDLREYADLLGQRADEASLLCEEILVQVTSFFRDPEVFESLKTLVFPKLLDPRPHDASIRVWVLGCATGEEVYSLAICLLEFLSDAHASDIAIKLFGTDLSLTAIEKARSARYPASIERDVTPERLVRFFSKTDQTYRIRKDVRELCIFAKHDATRDPPFSGMDLVSCRNLMIYLGPALQDRVLPTLHYALKEPGFLALGNSETIRSFPGFVVVDAKNKIYARTSAAPRFVFDALGSRRLATPLPNSIQTAPLSQLDVHREADRIVLAGFAPAGVVITDDLAIVEFRGKTGPFLEPSSGAASFDLLRMVREELRLPLRRAIDEARSTRSAVRRPDVTLASEPARAIELEVIPFGLASTAQRYFVVLFKESSSAAGLAPERAPSNPPPQSAMAGDSQLMQELASTRDYLQSVIERLESSNEELKAANEEIVSSNEELLSTNDELQVAKEELEATNQELHTVNEEMAVRNAEAKRLTDDLMNVLNSVELPIVMLGRDACLRRFTPTAAKLFGLTTSDVGRAISNLKPVVGPPELTGMMADVLEHLSALKRTLQDAEGRWYQLAIHPYLTADNRIDGTVISVFDIDELKKGEQLVAQAREYAQSIVDTVGEGLIVLDGERCVRSANRAFCETFRVSERDLEGRSLFVLGSGEWNIPALRSRLEKLDLGEPFERLQVEREFEGIGPRVFILNARRMEHTSLILLALDDVTEREQVKSAFERTEKGFQDILTTAAEAILMSDAGGKLVFANLAAASTFGYASNELLGLSLDTLLPGGDRHFGRRSDGTAFPIEVLRSSTEKEGRPIAVSFITDISRRQASEASIREYQLKLQRMAFDATLAEERERRRIAADLHDRIGQSLALAQIKLTSTRDAVQGPARAMIDDAVELLAQSAADTRTLTFELSLPVLYDLGLKAALSWLVEDIEKRYGIHIELDDDGLEKPLEDTSAALLYRSVRELLMNVFKHAHVTSAKVSLRRVGTEFEIEVADDGVGFDAGNVVLHSASSGFGLFSVREQISRLGGRIAIVSAPEQGTRVSMCVPLKVAETPTPVVPEHAA